MRRLQTFDPSEHDTAPNPIIELSSAAARGWCWMLTREPDGRWTLRHVDWLTGAQSEPVHTSPKPLADFHAAMQWARQHGVDLIQWTGNIERTVFVDAAYRWIRMIVDRAATPYAAAS